MALAQRPAGLLRLLTSAQCRGLATEAAEAVLAQPPPSAPGQEAAGGIRTLGGLPLPTFIRPQPKARKPLMTLPDAINEVKACAKARFDETVELAVALGIDPRRGDQMVRGTALLPAGTGRTVRVAVFSADASAAEAARAAGADVIGGEDLIARIADGGAAAIAFDKAVATPEVMPKLGKIARILGPRGLMPNPKLGTVTPNPAEAVAALKRGRLEFRADKGGIVHAAVGKASFAPDALAANAGALVAALLAARPKGVRGAGAPGYLLRATLSSTMGPGVPVAVPSLVAAVASSGA